MFRNPPDPSSSIMIMKEKMKQKVWKHHLAKGIILTSLLTFVVLKRRGLYTDQDFPGLNFPATASSIFNKNGFDIQGLVLLHTDNWNEQPPEMRYHVADRKYPFSRSCMCYAPWLGVSQEIMCQVMQSASSDKPPVNLAIADGWFRQLLCAGKNSHNGIMACESSTCQFTLVKEDGADYSTYDGLLQYSGDSMPDFIRPDGAPWFQIGYIGAEPDDAYATIESYRRMDYDVALSYTLPTGLDVSQFVHTTLLDLPEVYFSRFRPPPWLERHFTVASMISHCVGERSALIAELSRHIQIDQYGGCGQTKRISTDLPQESSGAESCLSDIPLIHVVHNNTLTTEHIHVHVYIQTHPSAQCQYNTSNRAEGDDEPRWIQQRCVTGQYKFYLAFENSQHKGYVTEKLWQALMMGSIPVYWGAPDVTDLLPHPDAIIRVSDFSSLKKLAEYIESLLTSPDAHEKHMQWRKQPLPDSFTKVFRTSVGGAACRLCDHIARAKRDAS